MRSILAAIQPLIFLLVVSFCATNLPAALIQENDSSIPKKEEIEPLKGDVKQHAITLVRQLGSSDFEARQAATKELWQLGPPALELLESAAKSSLSRESRMRAKDLVSLITAGIKPDADPDVVNCIVGFLDREISVQKRAIKKLAYLQEQGTAGRLIDLVPSKTDREALGEILSMNASDAEMALRNGDESFINTPKNASKTRKSRKLFYYFYLWVDGKLDPEIERLIGEAEAEIEETRKYVENRKKNKGSSPKKGKKANDSSIPELKQKQLKTLIGLLRFQEKWDEALKWSDKVYNKETRKNLTHSILMESGNWKGLADLIVDSDSDEGGDKGDDNDENEQPHNGLGYVAEGYKKALIEYYAGTEKEFEATISGIEKDIEDEFQKQKRRGAKPVPGNQKHAQFLRYALDFDRALKYTSLKKDQATFGTLRTNRRFRKLFDLFHLQTFEKRKKYFKGRALHIRSLQNLIERFSKEEPEFKWMGFGKDDEKRDRYIEKRDSAIYFWRQSCDLLADMGLDREAELYYRRLFFDFRDKNPSIGYGMVQDLAGMGAYESAWEIAKLECDRNKSFNPLGSLLNPTGFNHEAAQLLNRHFADKIKDNIERCRKIAKLVRSPADLKEAEPIDFWNEMAEVDLSTHSDAVWQLFQIWDVKEKELLRKSTSQQNANSLDQMEDESQFLLAAQKYDAAALTADGSANNYARAWYAYSRAGRPVNSRRMRLLFALKFDPDDAYEYTSGYTGTHWQSLPFDAYRLNDCLEYSKVGTNCYYMWKMCEDDSKAVLSARQKMVRTQILRLRYIESPYFENSENDHIDFIVGALEAGEIESARRWFRKVSSFKPADAGFVEKSFPVFERFDNEEFLDEMFEKVSADFYEILGTFPESAVHLNNYAWACACANRNVKNGIELAKRAVELRPAVAGHRDTLAELYHVDGQHDMAIKTIRRAIEINPMSANYIKQLKKFEDAKKSASAE